MNADSATNNGRPSAEAGCGQRHQTSAAVAVGCKATVQIATPPKQEQRRRQTQARVKAAKRWPWARTYAPPAPIDQGFVDLVIAKTKEMLAAHDEAARDAASDGNAKKAETIMREKEASLSNEDIKNDAHQREERATEETERAAMRDDSRTAQLKMCESSDSNETKRVRSDMGTRAVQELHGQHPSLSD